MTVYRVLVVDDSAFMRKIISDLIAMDPQFEIVATATNGREAIEAAGSSQPDVITMDLEMPEMNGLEALKRIMGIAPTPVIMLSSISDDSTRETINALQYGAFDFIRKPSGPLSPDIHRVGELLLEKMRIAVLTKRKSAWVPIEEKPSAPTRAVKPSDKPARPRKTAKSAVPPARGKEPAESPAATRHPAADLPPEPKASAAGEPASRRKARPDRSSTERLAPAGGPPAADGLAAAIGSEPAAAAPKPPKPGRKGAFRHLVVIGTSTGGPRALHEVITALPGDFPAPVLVVQHMPPRFTRSLAQRLDSFSPLRVSEASDGQPVQAGEVYIAPGGYHMKLARTPEGYCIRLTQEPPVGGHRPSVDMLFESCAPFSELRRHSVIMTGMGNDGVKGMKVLNESGAESAIAEAEESCIVYGMPRSAVEAGAARTILPLGQIASALIETVQS